MSLILKLKHPNVVSEIYSNNKKKQSSAFLISLYKNDIKCRLVEVIESPEEIFLIHEYLAGGQVLERICKRTKYNERVATKILKQLLEGLKVIQILLDSF